MTNKELRTLLPLGVYVEASIALKHRITALTLKVSDHPENPHWIQRLNDAKEALAFFTD